MSKQKEPTVDLGSLQKAVVDAHKSLKAAERAEQRASQALSSARDSHNRTLVALRNAFASVEGANK